MEAYKRIKKLAKEGKIHVKIHAKERALERGINLAKVSEYIQHGFVICSDYVEGHPDLQKPNKYYCICKSFLTWVTLILLLEAERISVMTVYFSKYSEKEIFKRKKRILHEMHGM